jgi:restriction endonuclease S subunit
VLKWAFEGKLTNSLNCDLYDLPDEHDLSMAAEPEKEYRVERNHNNQKNQKNHSSDKGELPEGWRWVKIEDIARINPKLPNKDEINDKLEIQFLPMKLVEEIINKIHLAETRLFSEVQRGSYTPFIDGDIIFAKVTPCMENGKIAVVENLKNGIGYGSSEFHVLRCSEDALNKYLFYFLVQDSFRNEAQHAMTGAVGLRRVPKQFIENHLIPLPGWIFHSIVYHLFQSKVYHLFQCKGYHFLRVDFRGFRK